LRRIVGFDLIHAWRNRKGLFAADIVWTHTELKISLCCSFSACAAGVTNPRSSRTVCGSSIAGRICRGQGG
jgi:hypothetical protein